MCSIELSYTQIHIDGHSDDGPPEFRKGYPRYRYPKTKEELRVMMQSNDMFIQVGHHPILNLLALNILVSFQA